MQISIKTNFPAIQAKIEALGKQTRYAAAVALTKTAQDVRTDLQVEMTRVFDRPTRFTLNSLYLSRATRDNLTARVWLKDGFGTKAHYLIPQIEGGSRPQKRFEELLRQRGVLASAERTVPAAGAKLDSYGNMSRGQIVQILSQVGAFNLAGASQNATGSRRSRAKRSAVSYFVARHGESRQGLGAWKRGEKSQHLASGIYMKSSRGSIVPVLIFVKGVRYNVRLRFQAVALKTVDRVFAAHFTREYDIALRTAQWNVAAPVN